MNVRLNTTDEGKIVFTKDELEAFIKIVRDDAVQDYIKEQNDNKSLHLFPLECK